ncbi:MAG: hypothetical protein WCJ51_04005, partial [Candidatus Moraniibacteriota bacterium]
MEIIDLKMLVGHTIYFLSFKQDGKTMLEFQQSLTPEEWPVYLTWLIGQDPDNKEKFSIILEAEYPIERPCGSRAIDDEPLQLTLQEFSEKATPQERRNFSEGISMLATMMLDKPNFIKALFSHSLYQYFLNPTKKSRNRIGTWRANDLIEIIEHPKSTVTTIIRAMENLWKLDGIEALSSEALMKKMKEYRETFKGRDGIVAEIFDFFFSDDCPNRSGHYYKAFETLSFLKESLPGVFDSDLALMMFRKNLCDIETEDCSMPLSEDELAKLRPAVRKELVAYLRQRAVDD